ncbi:MAG: GTPase [Planctomycetota bacterium]
MNHAWFSVRTRRGSPSAIGVLTLGASTEEALIRACNASRLAVPPVGSVSLIDLLGIDRGLAIRWAQTSLDITPHGSPAVVDGIRRGLIAHGFEDLGSGLDPMLAFSEASGPLEASWLEALTRVRGEWGTRLLLAQRHAWDCWPSFPDTASDAWKRTRQRLFDPPTVAVVGPANVGKSTLVNALAGRVVSVTSDEAGTTRDAVGAVANVDGIEVRLLDVAGLRDEMEPSERAALALANKAVARADLVLRCGDGTLPPPMIDDSLCSIAVGLRRDLGPPRGVCDLELSLVGQERGPSIRRIGQAIRRALVPDGALDTSVRWVFWD